MRTGPLLTICHVQPAVIARKAGDSVVVPAAHVADCERGGQGSGGGSRAETEEWVKEGERIAGGRSEKKKKVGFGGPDAMRRVDDVDVDVEQGWGLERALCAVLGMGLGIGQPQGWYSWRPISHLGKIVDGMTREMTEGARSTRPPTHTSLRVG